MGPTEMTSTIRSLSLVSAAAKERALRLLIPLTVTALKMSLSSTAATFPPRHMAAAEKLGDERLTVTLTEGRFSGGKVTLEGSGRNPVTVTYARTTKASVTRTGFKASELLPPSVLQQELKDFVDKLHEERDVFAPLHPVVLHHYKKANEQHL